MRGPELCVLVVGWSCAAPDLDDPAGLGTLVVDPVTGPASEGTDTAEFPAPDCAPLILPGKPSDVAATPRPDHDAEVLALSVDLDAAVASQDRYAQVSADLAAIHAIDPSLAEVHVGCTIANGLQLWLHGAPEVAAAIDAGTYHAWDCLQPYYGARQVVSIDPLGVAVELDGVFGLAVREAYRGLPGVAEVAGHWFHRDDWPDPTATGYECTPAAGSIELSATTADDGTLQTREYRFTRPTGGSAAFRIEPGQAPVPID